MMKRFTLASLLWMVVSIPLFAAPAVASLVLNDITFGQCGNSVFKGTYRLSALDVGGTVINDVTPVDVKADVIVGSDSFTTPSIPHLANVSYDLFVNFPSTSVSTATLRFYLTSDPSVSTETFIVDCVNGTISVGRADGDDGRLNQDHGDLVNALYNSRSTDGKPEIRVYAVNDASTGVYLGTFSYSSVAPYIGNPPASNTKIATIGLTTLYALSSGEFQFDIGPTIDGELASMIFQGFPVSHPTFINRNIYRD